MRALTRADASLLQGRAKAIDEVVLNCIAERFTVVTSEPGMGVTSFLRAGVEPALREHGFIVATFSDWPGRFFETNLKETIAIAVRESADPGFFVLEAESLEEMLARIHTRTGKKAAVLLDQFEDYIRCHTNTVTSDLFDAGLGHAVGWRRGVFVAGLQRHAIPAFERMQQYIPNLLGFHIQLGPLTLDEARAAAESEARTTGMEIQPAAMNALLSSPAVAGIFPAAPDPLHHQQTSPEISSIHPFYLKLALGQLLEAEERLPSKVLQASTIELRGGVDRILLESLDPVLGELDKTQTDLLFRWCGILMSPKHLRLSVTEKGLTDYAGHLNRLVPALLTRLSENGILRSVEMPEAVRYEISRECFVPILRDWRDRREAAIVARRRAAFRITSISVAASLIGLMYVIYLIFLRK